MIEDDLEQFLDAVRGRRCLVSTPSAAWHGRLIGSTSGGDRISILFEHPERPDRMLAPAFISREQTVGSDFAPATAHGRRTPARFTAYARDGSTLSVTEDDPAERPAKAPAPPTLQTRRPEPYTVQGQWARTGKEHA